MTTTNAAAELRNANLIVALKSGKTTALKLAQSVGKDGFSEADYNIVLGAALRTVVTEGADDELKIWTSEPGKVSASGGVSKGGVVCIKTNKQFPTSLYASRWLDVLDQQSRLLRHIIDDKTWTCKDGQDRNGIVQRAQRMLDALPAAK